MKTVGLNKRQSTILRLLGPHIEKISGRTKLWLLILVLVFLFGVYGLYKQIYVGHIVTGMRDNVVWGLYIANFIFFIGISYAGAIIAATLHIFKIEWARPIIRISTLMAIVTAVIGPIFILLCIGRFDRLHHLFLYPRLQSPIVWDVLAITTYVVGAVIFLYLLLIKDFAIYRDTKLVNFSPWRHRLYTKLSLGYKGTPKQDKILNRSTNVMAILLIPMVVIVSSVLSWIFGMTLRPGWHSSIFGPYFVVASVYSGTGVIICIMWIFRKMYNLGSYFTNRHFRFMGFIMLVLAAAYGYFTFSEFLTSWYGSEKWDSEVINKLFNRHEYGVWFITSNVVSIILPIVFISIPKFRKPNFITLLAFLMVASLWIKRYLIVIPTLESPLLPIQDTRLEYMSYSATWVEWALTFAGIATFLIFFTLMSKFATIIPVSDYETDNPEIDKK